MYNIMQANKIGFVSDNMVNKAWLNFQVYAMGEDSQASLWSSC